MVKKPLLVNKLRDFCQTIAETGRTNEKSYLPGLASLKVGNAPVRMVSVTIANATICNVADKDSHTEKP